MGCPYQELQLPKVHCHGLYGQRVCRDDISYDDDYKYHMDQTRMITEVIKEAKLARTRYCQTPLSVYTRSRPTQP